MTSNSAQKVHILGSVRSIRVRKMRRGNAQEVNQLLIWFFGSEKGMNTALLLAIGIACILGHAGRLKVQSRIAGVVSADTYG